MPGGTRLVPTWLVPAVGIVLGLMGCAASGGGSSATTDGVALTPTGFASLPGWSAEHHAQAMPALLRSCAQTTLLPPDQALGGTGEAARLGGQAGQWQGVCAAARAVPPADDAAARAFLESALQPYAISQGRNTQALFTGYYEPEVAGARTRGGAYQTPLLSRPADLVQVDFGDFAPDLAGRRSAGRVQGGRLMPYYDRSEIEAGVLGPKRLELLWLADPVDAFFLQTQGSGRVRLASGQIVRVGFAGQNGRPTVPIGRLLTERGQIPADQVSMQTIRAWLGAHPDQAPGLMDQNPSYVFFRELTGLRPDQGAPGALGAALVPGRSVAVDRRYVPLGAPIWIDTTDPVDGTAMQGLMAAQDLGGAIMGPLRADIFFGWGPDAAARAGRMRGQGREYLLLPRPARG